MYIYFHHPDDAEQAKMRLGFVTNLYLQPLENHINIIHDEKTYIQTFRDLCEWVN